MITAWKWDEAFLPKNGGAMYGWFFWMWMGIMALEWIFLLPIAAKGDKKTRDRVVLIFGAVLFAAEVYKQVLFTAECGAYQWNLFPWQFCSVPMFAALLASVLKEGRVKHAVHAFLAFFGLIAGIMTLIIPEGLYWEYVTITCHSFFWHTSIVTVSLYLIVANGYAKDLRRFFRELLPASAVFSAAVGIALLLDLIWGLFLRDRIGTDLTFNMFYFSPFYKSSLPVLRDWQPLLPYPVFLMLYLLAFCIGAAVMWLAAFGIRKVFTKRSAKEKE